VTATPNRYRNRNENQYQNRNRNENQYRNRNENRYRNGTVPDTNAPVAFARTAACGILTDTAPGAGPVSQR